MKMFKGKEEKNLTYVLSKSADQESMLLLEELHGLLFGLAITPEVIPPDEWLPVIFEDEPRFDDAQDAKACIGYLTEVYQRMAGENNRGKLAFPFNLKKLSDFELSLVEGWAYGLFLALDLRPDIWGMSADYDEIEDEDLPEDILIVLEACSIVTAIALPEQREEIFSTLGDEALQDVEELLDLFYKMLPPAVEVLQAHGKMISIPDAV